MQAREPMAGGPARAAAAKVVRAVAWAAVWAVVPKAQGWVAATVDAAVEGGMAVPAAQAVR